MSDDGRLRVVIGWHMHQPEYRLLGGGEYQLPWTYLHAIKDYSDMAAHLEQAPAGVRAVVNFAPILLDQLADYHLRIRAFLDSGRSLPDPLLAALVDPVLPGSPEARLPLLRACLRANAHRLIARHPSYERLAGFARLLLEHPAHIEHVSDQYLADLLVWYHLAWLGESLQRTDARVQRLMQRACGYTLHDRRELLQLIGDTVGGIVPRYRRLAEQGRVELSATPYAHPIIPLLLDFESAREAMPEATLPRAGGYPGGEERARAHITDGLATFERHFGFRPRGLWPAEGGVSDAALRLFTAAGVKWVATGGQVLRNSLAGTAAAAESPHRGWRCPGPDKAPAVRCYFRDDGLSDLIGFTYADWHADDAVANLAHHLGSLAEDRRDDPNAVVTIFLDGENAWEYYPENGWHFLSALYRMLATHPRLRLTTFSECAVLESGTLPHLTAGSWVYGTFSTWIGEADKNRGWEMLVEAKRACDEALAHHTFPETTRTEILCQLAVCEGSDWFWWFGDVNPAETVSDFERLFRHHLARLYSLIQTDPPQYLTEAFTRGGGDPARGGVMRTGTTPQ